MVKRKTMVSSEKDRLFHSESAEEKSAENIDDDGEAYSQSDFVKNVVFLMFLYILQGIPLGLAGAVPTILQNSGLTYHQQAIFSFAFWPFSLKLIWAPIVDTKYIPALGLRKTWILISQIAIGVIMLILSASVDSLIASQSIYVLTACFFTLNFMAATQDIAVDGWAITILPKKLVGWASTCNSVGQNVGFFVGNIVFLTLESSEFVNKYFRSVPETYGLVTFPGFMFGAGIVFIFASIAICIFKSERHEESDISNGPIYETYLQLWSICKQPVVKYYVMVVLTWKIGFAAAEGVTSLKLIDAGLTRDRLALMAVPLTPIELLLPLAISRISSGPAPLMAAFKATPWRLLSASIFPFIVHWTKSFGGQFSYFYYAVILAVFLVHQVFACATYVNVMAFHASVSDRQLGGTYMTLLNTFTNLGGNWPVTVALWFVQDLGFGGLDGYYIECAVCFCIGIVWFICARRIVQHIQNLGPEEWVRWRRND